MPCPFVPHRLISEGGKILELANQSWFHERRYRYLAC